MKKVVNVRPLPHFELDVEFEDGVRGTISLAEELWGPVFEPLKQETMFNQVKIDEFGAVCWPCGADLAPDALYADIVKQMQPAM